MKKLLILLLVIVMLSTVIVGCDNDSSEPSDSIKKDDTTKVDKTEDTPVDASTERYKVVFLANTTDHVEDGFLEQYIEKMLIDVDIEWLNEQEAANKVDLMIANGNPPDIWWGVSPAKLQTLYEDAIIRSIPDDILVDHFPGYIQYYQKASPGMDDPYVYVRRDGEIYGLPALWTIGPYSQGIGVRTDWMANVGITKNPETIEEYGQLLQAFTEQDPDGDGNADTIGLTTFVNMETFGNQGAILPGFSHIFGAYGVSPGLFIVKDGRVTLGEIEPGTKDALVTLNKWYEAGWIDQEFMVNEQQNMEEKIYSSKAGSLVGDWFNFYPKDCFWSGKYLHQTEGSTWTTILPPVGPNGDSSTSQKSPMTHIVVFGIETGDELMSRYMDVMQLTAFNPEGLLAYNKGEEDVTFNRTSNGGYEWIAPYDDEVERIAFGLGKNKDTYNAGGFFNDYDLQFEYMTAPEFIEMRQKAESMNKGDIDQMAQVVLPVFNENIATLNEISTKALIKFISGDRPISEFDDYVAEWLVSGGQDSLDNAQEIYDSFNS